MSYDQNSLDGALIGGCFTSNNVVWEDWPNIGGGDEGLLRDFAPSEPMLSTERDPQLITKDLEERAATLLPTTRRNRHIHFPDGQSVRAITVHPTTREQLLYWLIGDSGGDAPRLYARGESDGGGARAVPCSRSSTKPLADDWLDKTCVSLNSSIRRSFAETAVWKGHLVVSWLLWDDGPRGETGSSSEIKSAYSPLLLLPVELIKPIKGSGSRSWHLAATADRTIRTNNALLYKLQMELGVSLQPLSQPPSDITQGSLKKYIEDYETGVKTSLLAAQVQADVICERDAMKIVELGFAGEAVYDDVTKRSNEIVRSEPFKGLWEKSQNLVKRKPNDGIQGREDRGSLFGLDETQQAAVVKALTGDSVVIQGPPGTGKSQTIAALIVELLRDGKTVLFVAEKLAAVEAVTKRLHDKNFLKYVANLHSPGLRAGAAYGQWADSGHDLMKQGYSMTIQPGEQLNAVSNRLDDYFKFIYCTLRDWGMNVLDIAGTYQQHASVVQGPGVADLYASTQADILSIGSRGWRAIMEDVGSYGFEIGQGLEVLREDPVWEGILRAGVGKRAILDNATHIRKALNSLNDTLTEASIALGVNATSDSKTNILDFAQLLLTALRGLNLGLSAAAVGADHSNFKMRLDDLLDLETKLRNHENYILDLSREEADLYKQLCLEGAEERLLTKLSDGALYGVQSSSLSAVIELIEMLHICIEETTRLLSGSLRDSEARHVQYLPLDDVDRGVGALAGLQRIGVAEIVLIDKDKQREMAKSLVELQDLLEREITYAGKLPHYDTDRVREDPLSLGHALEVLRSSRILSWRRKDAKKTISRYATRRKWGRRLIRDVPEVNNWLICLRDLHHASKTLHERYGIVGMSQLPRWEMSDDARRADEHLRVLDGLRLPELVSVEYIQDLKTQLSASLQSVAGLSQYGLGIDKSNPLRTIGEAAKSLNQDLACLATIYQIATTHKVGGLSVKSIHKTNEVLRSQRGFIANLNNYLSQGGDKLSRLDAVPIIAHKLSDRGAMREVCDHIYNITAAAKDVVDPSRYQIFKRDCDLDGARATANSLEVRYRFLQEKLATAAGECLAGLPISEEALLEFFEKVPSDEIIHEKIHRMASASKRLEKICSHNPDGGLENLRQHLLTYTGARDVLHNANQAGVTSKVAAVAAVLAPLLHNTWSAALQAAEDQFGEDLGYFGDSSQLEALMAEYRELERGESSKDQRRASSEIDMHRRNRLGMLQADPKIGDVVRGAITFINRYGARGSSTNSRTKIREALAKPGYMQLLTALTPCFIASPDSASMYIPLDGPKFDVLIFDEASQIMPIRAAACLGRAHSVVVAGDSKQLPPTNFFNSSYEDEEDNEEDFSGASLLDEAAESARRGLIASASLLWHYRSRHDDLIRFSNKHFYGDKLQWFTASNRNPENGGISFHHIKHAVYAGKGINEYTARRSLELAMHELDRGESVGIVTFSKAQADYITNNLIMNEYFEKMRDVDREDPTSGFFVKNLENVQGDERDVIILDFPYGKKEDGTFAKQFGPLSQRSYGERRINVAITRARSRMHVVSGVTAKDFGIVDQESGSGLLQSFLEYAESPTTPRQTVPQAAVESIFEEQVLDFVEKTLAGLAVGSDLEVHTQVGCQGYRIDLAIYNTRQQRYILGIECDGAAYHSSRHARSRDRIRHEQIVSMGWVLYHVWGGAWFSRRQDEAEALRRKILSAI